MTTNEFMSPWFYLIDAKNGRQGVGVGFLFMNLFLCHNNLLCLCLDCRGNSREGAGVSFLFWLKFVSLS